MNGATEEEDRTERALATLRKRRQRGTAKSAGTNIVLSELTDIPQFRHVNVTVKAVRKDDVEEVPGGKKVQSIIIADNTSTARLTV